MNTLSNKERALTVGWGAKPADFRWLSPTSKHEESKQIHRRSGLTRAWVYASRQNLTAAAAEAIASSPVAVSADTSGRHRLRLDILWSFIHLMSDDGDLALECAEAAKHRATELCDLQWVATLRRCAFWRLGDMAGFVSVPRPALSTSGSRRTRAVQMFARCIDAAVELQQLRLATAAGLAALCDSTTRGDRALVGPAVFAAVLAAEIAYERGQLFDVDCRLRELMPRIRSIGALETAIRGFVILARAAFRLGKAEFAISVLREGESLAGKREWPRLAAACLAERIEILIDLQRRAEAAALLDCLETTVRAASPSSYHSRSRTAAYWELASSHFALVGEPTLAAAATIRRLLDEAVLRGDLKSGVTLGVRLVRLLIAVDAGDRAIDQLEWVLGIGSSAGLFQTLIDGGPALRDFLSKHIPRAKRSPHVDAYAEMLLATWPEAISHDRREFSPGGSERPLTPREREVLQLISLGHSNKGIAQMLNIAPETVKTHAKRIFARLGTSTRAAAVARATTLGII